MAREKKHKSAIIKDILDTTSDLDKKKIKRKMLFALKLKQAITSSGMNNSQFAEKIGKTKSTISKWLSGTHNFTIDTIYEIEDVLKIKISEIETQKFIQPKYSLNIVVGADKKSKIKNTLIAEQYNSNVYSFQQEEIKC